MAPSHPYWRDWSHGVAAINMLGVIVKRPTDLTSTTYKQTEKHSKKNAKFAEKTTIKYGNYN